MTIFIRQGNKILELEHNGFQVVCSESGKEYYLSGNEYYISESKEGLIVESLRKGIEIKPVDKRTIIVD